MKEKESAKTHLLWLDLEMTGTNPAQDVILEIACAMSDNALHVTAEGPELVIHQSDATLAQMNDWCKKQHAQSGLIERVQASKTTIVEAEEQIVHFVAQYCKAHSVVLCGNSIHQDRAFLAAYMPRIFPYLHYRMIDVSTVKELVRRWYPNNPHTEFKKSDTHRAMSDVYESIAELQNYRHYFFN